MSLKNWNTPFANSVHGLLVALNLALGVSNLSHHRNHPWISFFSAGLIVGINIHGGIRTCKLARLRATIAELETRRLGMTSSELQSVNQKARQNLEQIVVAVGARIEEPGLPPGYEMRVYLRLGDWGYMVSPGHVRKMTPDFKQLVEGTCFRVQGAVPYDEYIAAALLLLKNDPTIFDRWARQDAFYA